MYYRQNPLDEAKNFFRRKSVLSRLIIINVAVFLLVNIINLFFWLFRLNNHPGGVADISYVAYYLSVPANLQALLHRPWTLITYMFLHENFFHIFFNMFVLYFGGRIFMEYLSDRKLLSTYLLGGLTGAVFYIAAFNIFPVFDQSVQYSVALGASASVLAILIAIATYVPDYSVILFIFGRVKLKYLALILIAIDLLSINRGNAGGHIAHLGGAFWGFASMSMMKKGRDVTLNLGTMNLKRFFKFFTRPKRDPFPEGVDEHGRPLTDEEYNARKNHYQDRIDHILEKISKSGYNSLTKEEKELLFKSSNRNS